jgi:hypothetical protein
MVDESVTQVVDQARQTAEIRSDQLVTSVLVVIQERDNWLSTGAPRISNNLMDAIDDLVTLFSEGDIPGECRPLFGTFPAVAEEWRQFAEYASENQTAPRPSFWAAFRQMEAIVTTVEDNWEPPVLETIDELLALDPPCTWRNIAYIYSHKGKGPFMRSIGGINEPVPSLVIKQHKYEMALMKATDPNTGLVNQGRLKGLLLTDKECKGGEKIIPDGWVHPAHAERLNAGARVEKRLKDRALRLLGGVESNGHEAIGPEDTTTPDYVPRTRAELDRAEEGGEAVADDSGGIVGDSTEPAIDPDDPVAARMAAGEKAKLAADIFRLHDMDPNVTNRSIAETLGCSINEVKRVLSSRDKA